MASNFESLVFEIIAKDAQASAAFDRFRNSVDKTSKSVDGNSAALDKNAKAQAQNKQAQVSALGALIGLGVAFGPITAGAAAAGVGVAAFAGLAVPSVVKVATALHGPGGLAAAWVTLDNGQRNVALGLQSIGRDYTALAKQMEPRVFQVFNQGLSLAHSLLGPTGQLARASGQGISDFLAAFSASSGLQHFIAYLSGIARPAIGLLGSDVTHIAHAVFGVLQSFGGAGIVELRALTGVFTALDDSISFLSQHAPGLTSAGLAIGGIALALSKLGLLSGALKITGISSIAGQMTGFTAATRGATAAEKGLLATTTAFGAITPWGWVALGAAALGGLVFWLSRSKTQADDTVTAIEAQSKAVGFNTAGYLAAAAAIKKTSDVQGQATVQLRNARSGMVTGTASIDALTGATDTYTGAQKNLISEARNQDAFLTALQVKYNITRDAAASLASHSGALASQVNKGGQAMKNTLAATEAWANANVSAKTPMTQLTADVQDFANATLTATLRQTALTNALKLSFDPANQYDQDLITLKSDQLAMNAALQASAGKTAGLAGAQGASRQAFDAYISQVRTTAFEGFAATNQVGSFTKVVRAALPGLYAAAAGNKALTSQIGDLVSIMRRLQSEHVSISVGATGHWQVIQDAGGGRIKAPGAAAGMFIGQGRPGVDDQLIMAQRGELVVPAGMVARGAVDHLRGRIPGFADGGVVGGFAGNVPGLGGFLQREDNATLLAIANSVALATLAGIRAAQKSAVGPASGNAVVRYAESFLGAPYVWGGTTPAGWDCSGATGFWYRHFGISAPRTSQQQQLWATPSRDRAGALVFFYGTNGTATHVGLSTGTGMMVNAANPAVGTVMSSTAGNTGFGVPPGSPGGITGSGGGLPPRITGNSFDGGGYLPPGLSLAWNGTGRPERVGPAAGTVVVNVTVQVGHGTNPKQAAKEIADILNQGATAGVRLRKSILSTYG